MTNQPCQGGHLEQVRHSVKISTVDFEKLYVCSLLVTSMQIIFNFNPLGAAGVAGAVVYAALTFLISPKATLLIQLFMPLVMLATYFFILGKPGKILPPSTTNTVVAVSSTIQARGHERGREVFIYICCSCS